MLYADVDSQVPYIRRELESLVQPGSFASYMYVKAGAYLNVHLEGMVNSKNGNAASLKRYPVAKLFQMVSDGWRLDLNMLRNQDGRYISHLDQAVPQEVVPTLSDIEHLACYGLWLLNDESRQVFPPSMTWAELVAIAANRGRGHEEACVAFACQALEYAHKLVLHSRPKAEDIAKAERSAIGKKAADARYEKPGGSRSKRRQICEIWATGKYNSRDVCAEQECAALGMSFSTARKALRNTPDFHG